MTAPSIDAVSVLIAKLAEAREIDRKNWTRHRNIVRDWIWDAMATIRSQADALEAQARKLTAANDEIERYRIEVVDRLTEAHDAHDRASTAEARIAALQSDARKKDEALVMAAAPLEAMLLAGSHEEHSDDVQDAIKVGAEAARTALSKGEPQ